MKDNARSLFGVLGLAQRAGAVRSGETAVQAALSGGQAVMVFLDAGASVATKERYTRQCAAAGVPLVETPEGLGGEIGKPGRMVCALTGKGFKKAIDKVLVQNMRGCV